MSTMLKFVIIITGLIVLLNAGGIETNSGGLVKEFLNGGLTNFGNSDFWNDLIAVLGLSLGVGVVASLFGRSPDIAWALAVFVSVFAGLVLFDLMGIYATLTALGEEWVDWVASAIFIPLAIGFVVIVVNFWRGND